MGICEELEILEMKESKRIVPMTVALPAALDSDSPPLMTGSSSDSMTGVLDNDCDVYGLDIAGSERKIYELQYIHSARNSWRGYLIRDCVNGRDLLKVKHLTKSGIRRRKTKSLPGVPVLMMKAAAKLGQHYWLTVAETGNSVGDVSNGRMARMHENSKIYTANVHNLTAEEAVLWLTLICATDMKRSIIPQKTTRHSKTISLFHPK